MPFAATPQAPTVQWRGVAQAVGLIVAMTVCYWQTLDGGFFWDDHLVLPAGAAAQSLGGLRDIWFSAKSFDYYPLTYSLIWFEWHVFGDAPLGYHLVNLGLGMLNVFGLWAVLATLRVPGAWLGALVFAVHPLSVASIAWIAETKNTLSAVFYLGCLWLFVRSEERGRGWYGLAVLAYALAALCKSSVVMLPCVLLIMAWRDRGRITVGDLRRSVPFFAVSIAAGLLTVWYHHRAYSTAELQANGPLSMRALIAGQAILFYLGKMVLPVHLSMIYPRWEVHPASALAWLLLAAAAFVLWAGRDRWGRGPAAWFAYVGLTLLPISGLAPGTMPAFAYVFDHLAYLATMGMAGVAGAVLMRWKRPAIALVILALTAATLQRASDFSSSEALWTSTLRVNPECPAAHNNLGLALADRWQFASAEAQFRIALAEDPAGVSAAGNLGNVLQQQGKWSGAAAAYAMAVTQPSDAKDLNNYGVVLLQLGENDHAAARFREAAVVEPQLLSPRFNLYKIAASRHDWPAAVDELDACLRIDPNDVPSLDALAVTGLQVAPPGTTPPAAALLAKRAQKLSGGSDPISAAILTRSIQPREASDILQRIERIAARLR